MPPDPGEPDGKKDVFPSLLKPSAPPASRQESEQPRQPEPAAGLKPFGTGFGKRGLSPTPPPPAAPPSGSSMADDIASIGQGIAGLLAEEEMELTSPGAAAPAKANGATNGNAFASLLAESSAYTRPREYGGSPEEQESASAGGNGDSARGYASVSRPTKFQENCSALQRRLITQIAEAMWFPSGTSDAVREDRVVEAFDALQGIDPQDEVEGMLACQLVVTHRATLDCLQLSMAPSTSPADRTTIIDQIDKLVAIYARNLAALDKHRGLEQDSAPKHANGAHSAIEETLMRLKAKETERQRPH